MTQRGFRRRLSAILSADVVEYGRLMGNQEDESEILGCSFYRGTSLQA